MEYVEHHPTGLLGLRVRSIWALRAPLEREAGFEPVFPDGCIEFVLNLADPFERSTEQGVERQDRILIVGQMLRPAFIRPTGAVDLVGVRFEPWGAYQAADAGLMTLVDRIAPGEALLPGLAAGLRTTLPEVPSLAGRCLLMERALATGFLRPLRSEPPAALVALSRGAVRQVSLAARMAGMTPRHLERLSERWIGLPPRELVRLTRFQRALHRLQRCPALPLARVALESGFTDQSHFTRDFRRFSGVTPAAFRARMGALTATFIADPDSAPSGGTG